MNYYVATITVSVEAKSDEDAVLKTELIRKQIPGAYTEKLTQRNGKGFFSHIRHIDFNSILRTLLTKQKFTK